MNPFANSPTRSHPSPLQRFILQPALLTFGVCLLIGLALVAWRAGSRADAAHARAGAEALARAAGLELQFQQAVAAAETLGALARQSGGTLTNFPQLAAELLAAHPGLATLEWQPAGVVMDIVPRSGNERAIGFNVLTDPVQQPAAYAAVQTRRVTVSGPLRLYRGEPGLVARAPVLLRTRDGRDYFWGFVAASMRLSDALGRARVDDLAARGYDYIFFAPAAGRQKAVALASRGQPSLDSAVLQTVRAQNVEFRLAVQPRSGWFSTTKLVLEIVGVLVVSALAGLLVHFRGKLRASDAVLAETSTRTTSESVEVKQKREELRVAREATAAVQAKLNQAERNASELKAQFEAATRAAQAAAEASQAELQQSDAAIADLQARVESAARAASEAAESSRAQLAEASLAIRELQARLEETTREARTAAQVAHKRHQQDEQTISDLQSRLNAATAAAKSVAENLPAERARSERAIADLQARLDVATESAKTAATASAAKLEQAGQTIRSLEAQLHAAATAEARAAELATLLAAAHAALAEQKNPPRDAEVLDAKDAPAAEHVADEGLSSDVGEETVSSQRGEQDVPPPAEPPPSVQEISSSQPGTALAVEPAASLEPIVAVIPTTTPLSDSKAAKPGKRKKIRRDDQLSLFGEEAAELEQAPPLKPAVVAVVQETDKPAGEIALPTSSAAAPEVDTSPPAPVPAEPVEEVHAATSPPPVAAPTAVAPPDLDLPEIDGLNIADGLAQADGNPKLYFKILRQFVEQQNGAVEKIRDLLVRGDPVAAARVTLDLKLATAAIGAEIAHAASASLEQAIHNQSDPADVESLWGDLEKTVTGLLADLKFALKPKDEKPAAARPLPRPPPVNPGELRIAVNQILPLLTDRDPGAKDCLKDNRNTFRSAFSPEGFVEFERGVKSGDYTAALEDLKKAARKHGISV